MKIVSTETIANQEYEVIDIVIAAEKWLNIALEDMIDEAKEMGADAIVGFRISSNGGDRRWTYTLYGTAVKFI